MATKTVSLTTTFTPASSCFASTFTVGPKYRDTLTRGYGNNAIVRGVDPVCYPNNFYGIDSIVSGTTVAPFYSPGICPSGWTTATTTVPAGATVTTATCCPSRMAPETNSLTNSLASYCVGGFYTASTGGPGTTDVVVVSAVTSSGTTSLSTGTLGIYVSYQLPIVIRYEGSTISLSSPAATTAGPTTPGSPTNTAGNSAASEGNGASLSPGASVGIGVGLGVGVSVILVLVALLFWTRRKKARRTAMTATVVPHLADHATTPYDPHIDSRQDVKALVPPLDPKPSTGEFYQPPSQVYEADAGYDAYRASNPSELPTQWHGHEADSAHLGSGPRPFDPR